MLSTEEKEKLWKQVVREFPSDPMMRDLHFIRALMAALKQQKPSKTYLELSEIVRTEFLDWLKVSHNVP
ncbi:MAG: hypothetical protein ACE5R6_03195 [Candidatus Heimdallarchaeota archaeon]